MKLTSILLLFLTIAGVAFSQPAIDQKFEWKIGGIKQVVWVKGNDIRKPIFLFLHGGPGNSVMSYADKFCSQLYDHFVVVHWDQRDVGETLQRNHSPLPLTLPLLQQDALDMLDSILTHFHRQKIYLAGHSWGTAIGFHLVRMRPHQIDGFISIGSMVHQVESERLALAMMKSEAEKLNDKKWLDALGLIRIPFETANDLYLHRRSLLKYARSRATLSQRQVEVWAAKWLPVFRDASNENLFQTLREVRCPVYFFAGRNDYQTNSYLAEEYYNSLKAPIKRFYWFEKAGHGIPSTYATKMQQIIIKEILPGTGAF